MGACDFCTRSVGAQCRRGSSPGCSGRLCASEALHAFGLSSDVPRIMVVVGQREHFFAKKRPVLKLPLALPMTMCMSLAERHRSWTCND